MTPQQAWGDRLAGPVQRRPVVWLTVGAIAGLFPAGVAAGIVIGRRRGR